MNSTLGAWDLQSLPACKVRARGQSRQSTGNQANRDTYARIVSDMKRVPGRERFLPVSPSNLDALGLVVELRAPKTN